MNESGNAWLRPSKVSSLGRQLAIPIVGLVSLIVLVGLISVGAVLWADRSSDALERRVAPIRDANDALTVSVDDAELAARGYAAAGLAADQRRYRQAARAIGSAAEELETLAAEEPDLVEPVEAALRAVDLWRNARVGPLEQGPGAYGERERARFLDVRAATAEVDARISGISDDGLRAAERVTTALLLLIAGVSVLGIGAGGLLIRQLDRELVDPLRQLSAVLTRLRSGDTGARAAVSGPQEIREIASAINMLAEENVRGRDVELDVLTRLQELDRVRTDLVSTVSHELRTPLTSIKGYLELLQDQLYDDLTEMQLSMLGVIRRNLERLTELISNLLALSRAEEPELAVGPLDLRGVVAEVASDVRVVASGRDISVRTVLPGSPVIMMGDRSQLIRAVSNLASNAVKFSRPGGTVELTVDQEGAEGVIEVTDEGIGIPAADLPGLGSRFYRASNAVRAEIAGTGLGLRIVQTILDHHGGTLVVDSVEGEGTRAVVRLPLRPPGGTTDG